MDSVSSLYETYLALPEKCRGTSFSGVEILNIGRHSVVLADALRAIKIITTKEDFIMPVEEEFKTLERVKKLEGTLFVTPTPLFWGKDPDFIMMSRLGKCCSHYPDECDPERAARAIGEFAALLWKAYKCVHTDLFFNNFTVEPDGKMGILDMAAVKEAAFPEQMLWTPLLYKPNIAPALAREFSVRTGIPLNIQRIEDVVLEELPKLLAAHGEAVGAKFSERVKSGLIQLADQLSRAKT